MEDEFKKTRDRILARLHDLRPIGGIAATRDLEPLDLEPTDVVSLAFGDDVPAEELIAFQDAGWRFLSEHPSMDEHGRRMFLDADGHIKIDAGALNLRFRPDADPASIEAFLSEHALRVRRKLGFAPNLFLVSSDAGAGKSDSVELAKMLTDENESLVIYAEPVLIEGIGSR